MCSSCTLLTSALAAHLPALYLFALTAAVCVCECVQAAGARDLCVLLCAAEQQEGADRWGLLETGSDRWGLKTGWDRWGLETGSKQDMGPQ